MVDSEKIGARFKEVRGQLSQSDFAEILGIGRQSIGRYEKGERLPDVAMLIKLKEEFDVDIEWLLLGGVNNGGLSSDELQLLALYRSAPLAGKMAAVGALQGVSQGVSIDNGLVVSGNGNKVKGGSYKTVIGKKE